MTYSEHSLMNVLQHDCAPGWRANATQDLLIEKLGNDRYIPSRRNQPIPRWPGNSPDMNVVENFGGILMDIVEEKIDRSQERVSKAMLIGFIESAIEECAAGTLITNLLESFPKRCEEVVRTGGAPLKY